MQGKCLSHYIKLWADKYETYGETKGGSVPLRHKQLVITSNYRPEDIWPEDKTLLEAIKRRFVFHHFDLLKI